MGLNFFWGVLAGLPKRSKMFRWVPLHGSELSFFFVVFWFWLVCPKVTKNKKLQTYVSCPASPGSLPMGLNFLFFGFGWSAHKRPKTKKHKVQTYVLCPASSGSLSMGLNLLF